MTSNSQVRNEYSMLQYAVIRPKPRPKNRKPTSSKIRLIAHIVTAGERNRPSKIEIPLTPPVEKLFGNLKK